MFITKPRSSEAYEGDTVIIMCEVIGDPKPEVIWLRDFLKVSNMSHHFFPLKIFFSFFATLNSNSLPFYTFFLSLTSSHSRGYYIFITCRYVTVTLCQTK